MKRDYKKEQEVNFVGMTLEEFMNYYNDNTPVAMPRATKDALKEFQTSHATLFDEGGLWTIDKHRRRVMDWLSSYHANI